MFDESYKPRNSIKGQCLQTLWLSLLLIFRAWWECVRSKLGQWKVFVYGAFNARGSGLRLVLVSPEGVKLERSLRLGFRASNNETEYEALIAGLRAVKNLGAKEVEKFLDSRLVVSQIDGSFKVRDQRMSQYLKMFENLRANLQKVSVVRVLRSQNSHAYSLAILASSLDDCIPRMIIVELLERSSIEQQTMVAAMSKLELSWLDLYIAFLSDSFLPNNIKEVEKVWRITTRFWLFEDGRLYR